MNNITLSSELVLRVLLRWGFNSLALWVASELIGGVDHTGGASTIITAALFLSVINAVLKPIVVILALPAILITIGLFSIIVNGLMVWLASSFVGSFTIDSLAGAVLAGMVVSLVNYALTTYLEERIFKEQL